jgi:hypothetical protein
LYEKDLKIKQLRNKLNQIKKQSLNFMLKENKKIPSKWKIKKNFSSIANKVLLQKDVIKRLVYNLNYNEHMKNYNLKLQNDYLNYLKNIKLNTFDLDDELNYVFNEPKRELKKQIQIKKINIIKEKEKQEKKIKEKKFIDDLFNNNKNYNLNYNLNKNKIESEENFDEEEKDTFLLTKIKKFQKKHMKKTISLPDIFL